MRYKSLRAINLNPNRYYPICWLFGYEEHILDSPHYCNAISGCGNLLTGMWYWQHAIKQSQIKIDFE